ncbi:MAG: hypothetical protein RI907_3489 [Pseudomonadota bacterium]|jgi:hypothetical protein
MGDRPTSWAGWQASLAGAASCATLVRVDEDGRPWVQPAGLAEPIVARCAVAPVALPPAAQWAGATVLVVHEGGDLARPIIVGFVAERMAPPAALHLEATDSVHLRCGEASVGLAADGQVQIKGRRVTSRATEANKVRGAVVLIN